MKTKELTHKLTRAGWIITHGSNHDLATHPDKPGIKLTIPRHTETKEPLAKAILKQAGL